MAKENAKRRGPPRTIFNQALRFGITGALNVSLNTAAIFLLTELLHLHYLMSYLLVFAAATLTGFFMNRSWSFGIRGGEPRRDLLRYVVFTVMTLVVALTGIRLIVTLGGNYVVAVAFISAALAPVNFIIHRTWSFGLKLRQEGAGMPQ